jgi:DNA-binding PadR family transcriptional regulator
MSRRPPSSLRGNCEHGAVSDDPRLNAAHLNATAAALLGLLHDGPLTGWQLIGCAQERIGEFWSLTPSQVYRELTAMAGRGLVDVGPPGPRDRKPYALTDAGREAFAAWVAQPPGADQVRIPLLLTIAFAEHLPAERVEGLVAEQRQVHAERLARYRAHRAAMDGDDAVPAVRRANLEFGLRHEEAVLAWFDALPRLLAR